MIYIKKTVKKFGKGGHIVLPKELIGQEVEVIMPVPINRKALEEERARKMPHLSHNTECRHFNPRSYNCDKLKRPCTYINKSGCPDRE